MDRSDYKIVLMVSIMNEGGTGSTHDRYWGATAVEAREKLAELAEQAPEKVAWLIPEQHFMFSLDQFTRYDYFIVPDRG